MLYMIIERFHDGNPIPIYARFREQGRLMPDKLKYISSWTSEDLSHCYQIMDTESKELLYEWIGKWNDLVDFEVVPVITSAEASQKVLKLEEENGRSGLQESGAA